MQIKVSASGEASGCEKWMSTGKDEKKWVELRRMKVVVKENSLLSSKAEENVDKKVT